MSYADGRTHLVGSLADSRIRRYCSCTFVPDDSPLFGFFIDLGEGFITGNILTFICVLVAISLMWFINRSIMQNWSTMN